MNMRIKCSEADIPSQELLRGVVISQLHVAFVTQSNTVVVSACGCKTGGEQWHGRSCIRDTAPAIIVPPCCTEMKLLA
jgi:hypothetical protein